MVQWPRFYLKSPYRFTQFVSFCCSLYLVLSLLYFSLLLSVSCYQVFSSCSLTLLIFYCNIDSLSPLAPHFISLSLSYPELLQCEDKFQYLFVKLSVLLAFSLIFFCLFISSPSPFPPFDTVCCTPRSKLSAIRCTAYDSGFYCRMIAPSFFTLSPPLPASLLLSVPLSMHCGCLNLNSTASSWVSAWLPLSAFQWYLILTRPNCSSNTLRAGWKETEQRGETDMERIAASRFQKGDR